MIKISHYLTLALSHLYPHCKTVNMFGFTKRKRIVTFRVAGLVVPGCEGPWTVVQSPTYAVLSRNHLCRELRARWGGVAKKWQMMPRGRGRGPDTLKKWWRHLWTAPNQCHQHHQNHHPHHDGNRKRLGWALFWPFATGWRVGTLTVRRQRSLRRWDSDDAKLNLQSWYVTTWLWKVNMVWQHGDEQVIWWWNDSEMMKRSRRQEWRHWRSCCWKVKVKSSMKSSSKVRIWSGSSKIVRKDAKIF